MTYTTHGHTATRPHGHTATRPHGHTATRPHGHTATRQHGHTATCLKLAFVFLMMFGLAACEKEAQVSSDSGSRVLQLDGDGPEFTRESILADAEAFATQIEEWRNGIPSTSPLDRETTIEQIQDMLNVYAARVDAEFLQLRIPE